MVSSTLTDTSPTMTSLTIAATGKSPLLRGLPVPLKLDKPADVATVADVKAVLAAKFPRVWRKFGWHLTALTRLIVVC